MSSEQRLLAARALQQSSCSLPPILADRLNPCHNHLRCATRNNPPPALQPPNPPLSLSVYLVHLQRPAKSPSSCALDPRWC
eukprot:766749-Hanusia_phi.AAC.3